MSAEQFSKHLLKVEGEKAYQQQWHASIAGGMQERAHLQHARTANTVPERYRLTEQPRTASLSRSLVEAWRTSSADRANVTAECGGDSEGCLRKAGTVTRIQMPGGPLRCDVIGI